MRANGNRPGEGAAHSVADEFSNAAEPTRQTSNRQAGLAGSIIPAEIIIPTLALFYGNARAPLAEVVPDHRYPGMWRVRWPDGSLSDICNVSRAKDAAMALAVRGPPHRNDRRLHWERCIRPAEASYSRFFVDPSTPPHARPRERRLAGGRP